VKKLGADGSLLETIDI